MHSDWRQSRSSKTTNITLVGLHLEL